MALRSGRLGVREPGQWQAGAICPVGGQVGDGGGGPVILPIPSGDLALSMPLLAVVPIENMQRPPPSLFVWRVIHIYQ